MEDDVKNLFQKIGKPVAGYQEINRTTVTEQARKRWPLLRDVNIHSLPGDYSQENEAQVMLADLPDLAQTTTINPAPAKAGLKHLFKSESPAVQVAPEKKAEPVHAFFHRVQPKAEAEIPVSATPGSGLLSKIQLPVAPGVVAVKPATNPADAQNHTTLKLADTVFRKTTPVHLQAVETTSSQETLPQHASPAAHEASAERDLNSVFNRLAGKPEVVAPPAASKSFFNKIFKS